MRPINLLEKRVVDIQILDQATFRKSKNSSQLQNVGDENK